MWWTLIHKAIYKTLRTSCWKTWRNWRWKFPATTSWRNELSWNRETTENNMLRKNTLSSVIDAYIAIAKWFVFKLLHRLIFLLLNLILFNLIYFYSIAQTILKKIELSKTRVKFGSYFLLNLKLSMQVAIGLLKELISLTLLIHPHL